jgi:hypothetical protein
MLSFIVAFLILTTKASSVEPNQASLEVIAFDENHISVSLRISVQGDYSDKTMQVRQNPPATSGSDSSSDISSSVTIEIWRAMSRFFDLGSNSTIFSYTYSYNGSYFDSSPKFFGFLGWPLDRYQLTFFISANFDFSTFDRNWDCVLPSQNYNSAINVSPATGSATYKIELNIQHTSSFETAYLLMLSSVMGSLYGLIGLMSFVLYQNRKQIHTVSRQVIQISSAMMFFVPAFEIALNVLKSPLSLVLSDLLLVPIVPSSAIIIGYALWQGHKPKSCMPREDS